MFSINFIICLYDSRVVNITMTTSDKFSFLVANGIIIMWSVQVFSNIFVSLGLMPITGLPLPFISYGGSTLIMNMMALGIILSFSKELNRDLNEKRIVPIED